MGAHKLHQFIGVGALLGLQICIIHVIDDARNRLLVVLFGHGRPPRLVCFSEVCFGVHDFIPLLTVIPDARDDDNGRPRIIVASGSNQQVFDEGSFTVTGWCA